MPQYFDSNRYLFILANEGAGGHRLGRIISCLDNVHWYSDPANGLCPWDVFNTDGVAGKNISPYHYDRLVDGKHAPLLGERIEKWWDASDISQFYNHTWAKIIAQENFQTILETKYLHWILHDTPEVLHRRFPQAKFIALIDDDIESVVDRYMETTAKFPVDLKLPDVRPQYLNRHAKLIKALTTLYKKPTEQDLWKIYNQNSKDTYRTAIEKRLTANNKLRAEYNSDRYLKVSWNSFDADQIFKFLDSDDLDSHWINLMK
jgi:hypothetical protein